MLETCEKLGLALICWSPLGGFLDPFNEHLFDRFREVAKIHDCSYQRHARVGTAQYTNICSRFPRPEATGSWDSFKANPN